MHPLRPVHVLAAAGVTELGVFVANRFNLFSLILGALTIVACWISIEKRAVSAWTWAPAVVGAVLGIRVFTFKAAPGVTIALVTLSAALYVAAVVLLVVQRDVPQPTNDQR